MRHWQKFRMRTENSSMKTYFRYFISNTGCLEEPDISISTSGDRRDAGLFIFAVRGTVPAVFPAG